MIVSLAIQNCLVPLGFSSFDHTWAEKQALAAASQRAPDLIVIGDEIHVGSAMEAARKISDGLNVPVLMVTGDTYRARKRLEATTAFKGPFFLNQIEEAVELARAKTGLRLPRQNSESECGAMPVSEEICRAPLHPGPAR